MNIMRVTFKAKPVDSGMHLRGDGTFQKDFVFHRHALLFSAQRVMEEVKRPIIGVEFFPGEGLTERDILEAIADNRFIGV